MEGAGCGERGADVKGRDKGKCKFRFSNVELGAGCYCLEHTLVAEPDFSHPDALSAEIERGALEFIREVEGWLGKAG